MNNNKELTIKDKYLTRINKKLIEVLCIKIDEDNNTWKNTHKEIEQHLRNTTSNAVCISHTSIKDFKFDTYLKPLFDEKRPLGFVSLTKNNISIFIKNEFLSNLLSTEAQNSFKEWITKFAEKIEIERTFPFIEYHTVKKSESKTETKIKPEKDESFSTLGATFKRNTNLDKIYMEVLPKQTNPESILNEAIKHLKDKNTTESYLLLREFLNKNPDHDNIWYAKATVELEMGCIHDALESLDSVLKINPNNQDGHLLLREIVLSQQQAQINKNTL